MVFIYVPMVTEYVRSNQSRCYSHGLVQGSPDSLSLSFSPHKSLSFEIGQGYRRGEREEGEGFACFASWLRQFVSAATNAAVVAVRLGPTGPPTLSVSPFGRLLRRPFIRRPYLSTHVWSAIPAGAPSLHSYPSLVPSTPFVFVLASEDAPTILDTYDTSILSIVSS